MSRDHTSYDIPTSPGSDGDMDSSDNAIIDILNGIVSASFNLSALKVVQFGLILVVHVFNDNMYASYGGVFLIINIYFWCLAYVIGGVYARSFTALINTPHDTPDLETRRANTGVSVRLYCQTFLRLFAKVYITEAPIALIWLADVINTIAPNTVENVNYAKDCMLSDNHVCAISVTSIMFGQNITVQNEAWVVAFVYIGWFVTIVWSITIQLRAAFATERRITSARVNKHA